MLYFIREIKEKHLLPEYEDFDVYLDSPLAIEATKVFTMNMRDCFDKEAMELVNAGITVWLGFTLGIHDVHYRSNSVYTENYVADKEAYGKIGRAHV